MLSTIIPGGGGGGGSISFGAAGIVVAAEMVCDAPKLNPEDLANLAGKRERSRDKGEKTDDPCNFTTPDPSLNPIDGRTLEGR